MKPLVATILFFLVTVTGTVAGQRLPEPTLAASQLPKYPPLAVQARIDGTVKLSFVLNDDGEVVSVEVVSGHPMLKSAAAGVVKTWRFDMRRDLRSTERRYYTEFIYRLSGREVDRNAKLTVSLDSFHRLEIMTDVIKGTIQYMCSDGPCPTER